MTCTTFIAAGDSYFIILFFRASRTMAFPVTQRIYLLALRHDFVIILFAFFSMARRGLVPNQTPLHGHMCNSPSMACLGNRLMDHRVSKPQLVWYVKRRPRCKQEDPWIWQGRKGGVEDERPNSPSDSTNNTSYFTFLPASGPPKVPLGRSYPSPGGIR